MGPPSTFCSSKWPKRRRGVAGPTPIVAGEPKRALYHCNYCAKDVSNCIRIKCAVCSDFDLCLECFSVGVELKGHSNSHAYRVMDNLSFPLFHPAWGADEELLLLESVDMFGLGNWVGVSEHVGSKSAEAAKQHYYDTYINVDTFPQPKPAPEMENVNPADFLNSPGKFIEFQRKFALPDQQDTLDQAGKKQPVAPPATAAEVSDAGDPSQSLGPDASALKEASEVKGEASSEPKADPEPLSRPVVSLKAPRLDILQHTGLGTVEGSEEKDAKIGEKDAEPEESIRAPAKKARAAKRKADAIPDAAANEGVPEASSRVPVDASGTGVAGATATPVPFVSGKTLRTDNVIRPEAIQLGTAMVEITTFNSKRDEFEHEYDNDAEVPIADLEFRRDDSEEEVAQKLHMLEVYNERLAERERRRQFIKESGLLNVKKLQAADKKRSAAERDLYCQLRVFARYLPEAQFNALVEGMVAEQRLRGRIQELKELRRNGIRTFSDADDYEAERKKKLADHRSRVAALFDKLSTSLPADTQRYSALVKAVVQSLFGSQVELSQQLAKLKTAGAMVENKSQAGSWLSSWRVKRGVNLDISAMAEVHTLSRQERELCVSARLLPAHYLLLKSHFMRESSAGRSIKRNEAKTYFRLEQGKALKIWDLLAGRKWIADRLTSTAPGDEGAAAELEVKEEQQAQGS